MTELTVDHTQILGYLAARTEGGELITWGKELHTDWLPAREAVWEARHQARAQGIDPAAWDVVIVAAVTPAQVRPLRAHSGDRTAPATGR